MQYVPELFSSLKLSVDQNRIPGIFILTGSTNLLRVQGFADAFAGRSQTVPLYPLSQQEIEQNDSSNFLENLFSGDLKTGRYERLNDDLAKRIVTGGYPEILTRHTERRRFIWYKDYLNYLVQKDITQLSSIHSSEALPNLLVAAANLSSQLFNVSSIAKMMEMNRNTVNDYLGNYIREYPSI